MGDGVTCQDVNGCLAVAHTPWIFQLYVACVTSSSGPATRRRWCEASCWKSDLDSQGEVGVAHSPWSFTEPSHQPHGGRAQGQATWAPRSPLKSQKGWCTVMLLEAPRL